VAARILAVDDEPKILEAVSDFLKSAGYEVYAAQSGQEALEIFDKRRISLVVLDLMLEGMSGEEVCAKLRKKSRVPIILLSAKSDERDLVNGFNLGADDYIVKPFSLKELLARISAVLRRSARDLATLDQKSSWNDGDLVADFERAEVAKKGEMVSLTQSELKILATLAKRPTKVFSREELIGIALGEEFEGSERNVDTHIKNLRKKIEDDPKNPAYVLTVHGLGYKFGCAEN
jgi:DNA-binding response OmpR family regulator